MIIRHKFIKNDEKTEEDLSLAEWAWHSHCWIETAPGYCTCRWCGVRHTSEMGINKDFPLCKENYVLKKLKDRFIEEIEKFNIQIIQEGI